MTSVRDVVEAGRVHVEDSLRAAALLVAGPVVDVGSGGGSPGIPLAAARPDLEFHLLEATQKKCAFLREVAADFPNVEVVCARAEEHGRGPGRDRYGTAVTRALAAPPVAAEWCLPLVAVGGTAILLVGPTADADAAGRVAAKIGGELVDSPPGMLVLHKREPTPPGFPRRSGVAKKRPLA